MPEDQPSLPPDEFSAPEGSYIHTPSLFPSGILSPLSGLSTSLTASSPTGGASPSVAPGIALNLTPQNRADAGVASASAIMAQSSPVAGMMLGAMGGAIGGGFGAAPSMPVGGAQPGVPVNPISPWPVRASWVVVNLPPPRTGGSGGFGGLLGKGNADKERERERERQAMLAQSGASSTSYEPSSHSSDTSTPASSDPAGAGYSARAADDTLGASLSPASATPGYMRAAARGKPPPRPKNSIRTTNSTFITRVSSHDQLSKVLATPTGLFDPSAPGGGAANPPTLARWAIVNSHRSLVFLAIDPTGKHKDALLMRINFSNNVTCHAVNELTKTGGEAGVQGGAAAPDGDMRLDLMVGYASGDLLFLDPIAGKYNRLNKMGMIHASPIISVKWHPTIPTIFYALHQDGLILVYSTERDDPNVTPGSPPPWSSALKAFRARASSATPPRTSAGYGTAPLPVRQEDEMFVWRNEEVEAGKGKGSPFAGRNPVAVWRIGQKSVKQFEFSPDGQAMAAVSDDGTLRVLEVATERVLDTYAGYFGGLTCVAWSPDGRFIITGGQDDLITIFSPRESRVVARCQGHSSFVSSLTFDRKRCNARGYRFGSVGEDGRILLWDFSSASLHRPRAAHAGAHRVSLGSTISLAAAQSRKTDPNDASAPVFDENDKTLVHYHPAPARNEVAMLQPVMIKLIEPSILTAIDFFQDAITTISRAGAVRFWVRPVEKTRTAVGQGPAEDVAARMKGLKVDSRRQGAGISVQG